MLFSHTIYPAHFDAAPGRGKKPTQVGITFQPTPCLTLAELEMLINQLRSVADEMEAAG